MKTILIKAALFFPLTFFLVYILLLSISGITCACTVNAQPLCSAFCLVAKLIIGAAIILIIGITGNEILKEIRGKDTVSPS